MSVWLHDVGKLAVPLSVKDKATRLGGGLERVEARFDKLRLLNRIDCLEGRISQEEFEKRKTRVAAWLEAIRRINTAPFLTEDNVNLIQEMARARFIDESGEEQPVLLPPEAEKLQIRKGTLTDGERKVMQGHVSATRRILSQVKFPEAFAMVPDWASEHHELLGGAGYPQQMSGAAIPREVRLLTILDIFEALTAKDRPYKKPIPVERSLDILRDMAREGSVDGEILDLFARSRAWEAVLYAGEESVVKELTLAASLENIPVVTAFVDEQLEALDCSMKAQMQIDVAIDELFGNIAHYAYPGGAGDATVRFDFDETTRTATIAFIDSGVPFNPLQKADPDVTLSAEERGIGGLGIFMVKKTMDKLEYHYQDGKNILTIQKHI